MTIKQIKELRALEKHNSEVARVQKLYEYENEARQQGYNLIAGVDEAGRGSLAGPMLVAAVILPPNIFIDHLNDSKKLTHNIRERLYDEIIKNAISYSYICVDIDEGRLYCKRIVLFCHKMSIYLLSFRTKYNEGFKLCKEIFLLEMELIYNSEVLTSTQILPFYIECLLT